MKNKLKKWIIPGLFTVCGGLVGYAYYLYMRCKDGVCGIGFSPLRSILYMAFLGWLISMLVCGPRRSNDCHDPS